MAYVKMADDLQRWWRQKREGHLALQQNCVSCKGSFMIPSAVEDSERAARARHCTDEGAKAGFKAACIAFVASSIPTLTAVRMFPKVKASLNYTGQALIVSAASIASYFIVSDQTIHECSRKSSYAALEKRRSEVS
uniref:Early nodulin 93 ENOD93 protein n=2 Tax=Physcomitrium patens TaxID=3218 RepID=A0A7I4AXP9_PHYPA